MKITLPIIFAQLGTTVHRALGTPFHAQLEPTEILREPNIYKTCGMMAALIVLLDTSAGLMDWQIMMIHKSVIHLLTLFKILGNAALATCAQRIP